MPGRDMGTQWGISSRGEPNQPDEISEHLTNFWHSLPKAKALHEAGINRFQQRKSNMYLTQAMSGLVENSIEAQFAEEERVQQQDELKQRKKSLLNEERFLASEADHPIHLDAVEYLTFMPKSWAEERKELEIDIKKKIKRRTTALKPKIRVTAPVPVQNSLELKLKQVRSAHSDICYEALQKTISVDRKKKIRSDLSDMDLFNRPMHHLKTPLIDKTFGDSLETMYSNVRRQVSEETLNSLLHPEPDLEEFLQDYFKTHRDAATPNEQDFTTKVKANLTSSPRLPGDQSSIDSESEGSTCKEYGMGPTTSSGFGLHCLRELVKFQDDEWHLQDPDSQSDKPPSSSGSSVHQTEETVLTNTEALINSYDQ